jgi:hypothetical protein
VSVRAGDDIEDLLGQLGAAAYGEEDPLSPLHHRAPSSHLIANSVRASGAEGGAVLKVRV